MPKQPEPKVQLALCSDCDHVHLVVTIGEASFNIALPDKQWDELFIGLAQTQKHRDQHGRARHGH